MAVGYRASTTKRIASDISMTRQSCRQVSRLSSKWLISGKVATAESMNFESEASSLDSSWRLEQEEDQAGRWGKDRMGGKKSAVVGE